MKNEKIVGTTFKDLSLINQKLQARKDAHQDNAYYVPTKEFRAVIVPEPDNQYDEFAKRVDVLVRINEDTYKLVSVGYLKADGALYRQLKVNTKKRVDARVKVSAFSLVDAKYNDSYEIVVD